MKYILSIEYKRSEDSFSVLAMPLLKKEKSGWKELGAEGRKELLPNAKKSQIELLFPEVKNWEKKVERDLFPSQLIVMDLDEKIIQERENPKKNEAVYFVEIPQKRFFKGYYTPLLSENIFFAVPREESIDCFQRFYKYGMNPRKKSNSIVLYDDKSNMIGPYRVISAEPSAKEGMVSFQREEIPILNFKLTGYRLAEIKVGGSFFTKGISYTLAIPPERAQAEKKATPKPIKTISQRDSAISTYHILEENLAHKVISPSTSKDEILAIKEELEGIIKRLDALLEKDKSELKVPLKGRQDGKKRAELFSLASSTKNPNESAEIYELYTLYVLRSELENYGFIESSEEHFNYKLKQNGNTKLNNTFYYKRDNTEAVLYYQPVIDQKPEDAENGIGLYRRKSELERDDDKYTPDYVLKISRCSFSEYLVIDAKFKPLKNIENEMERLIFRYKHSLSTANANDKISGIAIIYGKPNKKDYPRFQFEDMSFHGKEAFVYLCPLSEDGIPSHYTLKRFLKPFINRSGISYAREKNNNQQS